jgi:hypothetical protein
VYPNGGTVLLVGYLFFPKTKPVGFFLGPTLRSSVA